MFEIKMYDYFKNHFIEVYIQKNAHIIIYLKELSKSKCIHLTSIQVKKNITSSPEAPLMQPLAMCFQNRLMGTCAWETQPTDVWSL